MLNMRAATTSAILTVILTTLIGGLSILAELLAFNGVSERRAAGALGISLACQGAGVIMMALFARRLTDLLIAKFNWNKIIAVITSVFMGTGLGAGISFLSIIISTLAAGIR